MIIVVCIISGIIISSSSSSSSSKSSNSSRSSRSSDIGKRAAERLGESTRHGSVRWTPCKMLRCLSVCEKKD